MKKANFSFQSETSISFNEPFLNEPLITEKPNYTGRFLVTIKNEEASTRTLKKIFSEKVGIRLASDKDFKQAFIAEDDLKGVDALVFEDVGVALVAPESNQLDIMEQYATDYLIEPEQIMYAPEPIVVPSAEATFGLELTKVVTSKYSGKNVKIAVLDTGMDLSHPDFISRNIKYQSFIQGETVQDQNGHGTHCIGVSCGDTDVNGTRYGIASKANIYAGKVLSNAGSGSQTSVINGMLWGIRQRCKIISMSLGSQIYPGQGFSPAYERVGKYALKNDTLVVAAAGNASTRHRGLFNPVGSPANCPSILAVAAIDGQLNVADFSNRSINANGQIDIAAPGVNIYSSWPMNMRYRTISGTSMATPHVAGIAALYREKYPQISAEEIWWNLTVNARRILQMAADVGVGLAIAP